MRSSTALLSDPGFVTTASDTDFESTFARLSDAIGASPAAVIGIMDHGEASGGALPPTRLVIFGVPMIGTPPMNQQGSFGIDLPLKFVVWEDANGTTQVTTHNPAGLAGRHGVATNDPVITTIGNLITNFFAASNTATEPQ